jgi:hypothetical protein
MGKLLAVILLLMGCKEDVGFGDTHLGNRRFPIPVGMVGLDHCRAAKMKGAVAIWNRAVLRAHVQQEVFRVMDIPHVNPTTPSLLWVTEGPIPTDGHRATIGSTLLGFYVGKTWGAVITMNSDYCNLRASMHELGHALGLNHAPEGCTGCIMHPYIPNHEGVLVERGWLRRAEVHYVVRQMRLVPYNMASKGKINAHRTYRNQRNL